MKKSFLLPITLAVMAFLVLPMPGSSAPLSSRIDQKKEQIQHHKAKEGVLTTTIPRYSSRIDAAAGRDLGTQLQRNAGAERPRRQGEARSPCATGSRPARDRLARLRAGSPRRAIALADRLVELYKADKPDVVTVVLESDGFADLLERTEFMQRVSDQDARIIDRVRGRADQAQRPGRELAVLEAAGRRSWPSGSGAARRRSPRQGQLVDRRDRSPGALRQGGRAGQHARQPPAPRGRPRRAREGAGAHPGRRSSGAAAGRRRADPAGLAAAHLARQRPDRLARSACAGAACTRASTSRCPSGTPIRAAESGTRRPDGLGRRLRQLHLHPATAAACRRVTGTSRASAPRSARTCRQGQVIGYVGCTGHCFGPHVHFETRINGSPVDPMGYL